MAAELITWAGRTLSGSDHYGRWVVTDFEGWWDSPDTKAESVDRAFADGEFDSPAFNQARLITVTGSVHTGGHDQQHEAMNFLNGPMLGRLTVAGHGLVQWADMKRNSGVKFTPVTDRFAQWQVRLKAADPRKFGRSYEFKATTTDSVGVFHRGNYPATPTFVVSGSMAGGYRITLDGADYEVSVPLVAGKSHRIDYATGLLRINGAIVQNSIGKTTLTTVPPGDPVTLSLSALAGGTGSVVMELLDTFI